MYFWQDIILAIIQLYSLSNLKNLINNAKIRSLLQILQTVHV